MKLERRGATTHLRADHWQSERSASVRKDSRHVWVISRILQILQNNHRVTVTVNIESL